MTISERLFAVMEEKGLNCAALCSALGVNSSTVSNWKQRKTDPAAKFIVPICEFLGVTPEFLLTGKETKKTLAISANGREMLELYEMLPERDQILILGRLHEIENPILNGKPNASGSVSSGVQAM